MDSQESELSPGPFRSVLIASTHDDDHAQAVASQLRRWGVGVDLLLGEDYPQASTLKLRFGASGEDRRLRRGGANVDLLAPASVWWRRFLGFRPSRLVHSADWPLVEAENRILGDLFPSLVASDAAWFNPLGSDARACNKVTALGVAARCGLQVPETLMTNDRAEASAFIREMGEAGKGVIHKTLVPHSWEAGVGGSRISEAAAVTEEKLVSAEAFRHCPSILQVRVRKLMEARVMVLGDAVCAIGMSASRNQETRPDGKYSMSLRGSSSRLALSPETRRSCVDLVGALGLRMGAIDLLLGADGLWYFLEVNPQPQFLWMEQACEEVAVLEPFCRFLTGGHVEDLDFVRRVNSPTAEQVVEWGEFKAAGAEMSIRRAA
jgi:glutathione synthase/RimK-type ligase-like ATP-grasp enzyme